MTISIQLDPAVFNAGNIFEGIPRNRAVLSLGGVRDDVYLGKINTGTAANLSYRGGQTSLMIDTKGTDISDLMLENMMKGGSLNLTVYGVQLLDFMERALVKVFQDGAELTPTQVKMFTA